MLSIHQLFNHNINIPGGIASPANVCVIWRRGAPAAAPTPGTATSFRRLLAAWRRAARTARFLSYLWWEKRIPNCCQMWELLWPVRSLASIHALPKYTFCMWGPHHLRTLFEELSGKKMSELLKKTRLKFIRVSAQGTSYWPKSSL